MRDEDKPRFRALMEQAGAVYGEDISQRLGPYWSVLAPRLAIDDCAAAFEAHMADADRGRFFPRPADLMAATGGRRAGHLAADEAWALALASFDEARTIVWTSAIAEARSMALPIWDAGDRVGARMAFKAAYERICASGPEPGWTVSLGHDAEDRQRAITEAVHRGQLGAEQARQYLPRMEPQRDVPRLTGTVAGNVVEHPSARAGAMRRLAEILDSAPGADGETPRQRAERERRERIEAAKARAAEGLAALAQRRAEPDDAAGSGTDAAAGGGVA